MNQSAESVDERYMRGHARRVAVIARMLAVACGVGEDEADRIFTAGLFHDIGKSEIPAEILNKPGRLTDEEFDRMKTHAAIGAGMLEEFPACEDLVAAVRHHHERFDGNGYPSRLEGEEIPLSARILCLADSLDAMTSTRVYREGLPLENALEEISACAGKQFDPQVSGTLLKIPAGQLQTLLAA